MSKPRIRFKGFEDEWENARFNDVIYRIHEQSDESHLPRIEYEDIVSGEGVLNKNVYEKCSSKRGIRFKPNDVLFGKLRSYLKNIIYARFDGIAVGDFWVLCSDRINSKFIYTLVNSTNFQRYSNMSTGTKMPRSDWNLIKSCSFYIPKSQGEQNLIGEFYTSIERASSILTNKINALKSLKICYLNRLFPIGGGNEPPVRLAGFSGEWQEQEAGKIFQSTSDKGHPELPVLSATQDRGMIIRDDSEKIVIHDKKNEIGYKRVLPGQFVIHLRSFQGGFAHSSVEGITSPAYTVLGFINSEEHDDLFWKYVFNSKWFIHKLRTVTYGIRDGRNINYNEFKNLTLKFPSKVEQQAISNFIAELDKGIKLHEEELERLKALKESCLQGMFV